MVSIMVSIMASIMASMVDSIMVDSIMVDSIMVDSIMVFNNPVSNLSQHVSIAESYDWRLVTHYCVKVGSAT